MRRGSTGLIAAAAAIVWLAGMAAHVALQEIPTGWVEGEAVAEETGQPLPGATVRLHLVGPSPEGAAGEFALRTRPDGTFGSPRLPTGSYRVEASSRAHQLVPAHLLVEEGKTRYVKLELGPVDPFFELRVAQHVFTPDEELEVTGVGFVPDESVSFSLYRIDTDSLLREHWGNLWRMVHTEEDPESVLLEDTPGLSLARRFSARITRRDVEGVFRERFPLPFSEPGLFLVAAEAAHIRCLEWVMVTRLGLVTKQWGDEALAYVVDLKSGRPVPGAQVEFRLRDGPSVSGATDEDGVLRARLPGEDDSFLLLARAAKDGSEAFLTDHVWRGDGDEQDRVYLHTDRPVYRPGHTVRFKGIARRFAEKSYAVLANEPIEVEVRDRRETLVYRGRLATNEFGSYHGEFELSEEAATGGYEVVTTLDGRPHRASFRVAEYRKPEYSVEVATDKRRYSRGERIRVEASAQYYFGAPVAGAEVTYAVRRSPYWFSLSDEYEGAPDEEYESYGYGEVIETGNATTDGQGVATFLVRTRAAQPFGWAAEEEPEDHLYTIQVTVTDPSRKGVTASAAALVTQGEFVLLARPLRWVVSPDVSAEVELQARDYEGEPVAGAQIAVTAGLELFEGTEVRVDAEARARVVTDREGKALFRFRPRGQGHYRIEARATDRRGNTIRTASYIWVTGRHYADFAGVYPELELVADKEVYEKGETAVVLVNTERKGATALLTVEGPRLFEHRLVELRGHSTRVEVPIRPEYAPNCFISVAFVQEKQFVSQEMRIRVSVEERRLLIAVKPDRARYAPGEQVTYDLRTTDSGGRPVPAEVAVGVVDESIYAIQKESAPPMLGFFYPPRWNRVSTAYSFPHIYLDGNKDASSVQVRRHFPDTAYWNPTVVTGSDGRASVSFTMPDSLTTWRATVRGATLDTAVGEAVSKVQCTKDFLVRLEAPRFFVQRDRVTIAALVHNYTTSKQRVKVWLESPGLRLPGGQKATAPATIVLDPQGMERHEWVVEIPGPGAPELTVYALAEGGPSDAMALTVPALPHGRERTEWRSGAIQQNLEERLTVRKDAVPGASQLSVRLAPSLASVLLGSLEYLARYPYGCTEQTMSAFLPDIVVAETLKELEVSNPRLEAELPKMVQKGLDRLYGFQHEDGGWGWWRYDESDPWMTAYVVYGLTSAERAGFAVNEYALNRGLEWLEERLREQPEHLSAERLYALYVLSLAGRYGMVDRPLTRYYRSRDSLDSHDLALLASALLERNRRREAQVVAERLWRRAEETQSLVWWRGREGWGRGGDCETTALAFHSLARMDAQDDRLFRAVRWLLLNREGNHWVSTRDTAFVLLALTSFLKESEELRPDYQAVLTLNGATLLDRRFTREGIFEPEVEVAVPASALREGDNLLTLAKTGPGNLYYTITFRQFIDQEEIPKLVTAAGISVQRAYYPLVAARDRHTGVITTSPAAKPTTQFRSGEPILVRLTIKTPREYEYVVVEDPLPAGCEAVERGDVEPWEWDRWWSDVDVRDEKVAFFARRLRPGTWTIEYHLRPQIPGDYHTMPTQVWAMYNPEVRGSGPETRVRVR